MEDRLQEGVPETIEKLREARVKVFMLTGDKQQTAEEIGHATRMLGGIPPENIFRITEDAVSGCRVGVSSHNLTHPHPGEVCHSGEIRPPP